jgi:hypothetical protein
MSEPEHGEKNPKRYAQQVPLSTKGDPEAEPRPTGMRSTAPEGEEV